MRQVERIAKLTKELKFIEDLIALNTTWKKKEIENAKYVFLNTMVHLMPEVDINEILECSPVGGESCHMKNQIAAVNRPIASC